MMMLRIQTRPHNLAAWFHLYPQVLTCEAAKQLQARSDSDGAEASSSPPSSAPTHRQETTSCVSSGLETGKQPATTPSAAAAVGSTGGHVYVVRGATVVSNIDLGEGVRVIATGPKLYGKPQVAHVLWVVCYDATLEGEKPIKSRHAFLLCEDERFQPRQPRQELSITRLGELVGYTSRPNFASIDLRLAQDWQSAPGGPVHAQGTRLGEVSVCSCNRVTSDIARAVHACIPCLVRRVLIWVHCICNG